MRERGEGERNEDFEEGELGGGGAGVSCLAGPRSPRSKVTERLRLRYEPRGRGMLGQGSLTTVFLPLKKIQYCVGGRNE